MADNNQRFKGTSKLFTPTGSTNAPQMTVPVIGIVKNNIDASKSGRIDVYIARFGGSDPNNSDNWVKGVRYLSPFFGNTSGAAPTTGEGSFVGNPVSYGFWASAPDIGTQVLCIFADGRLDQGYYIGCIPTTGQMQMTPAIGASTNVVPNATESTSYGGADRLPTSEVNVANPALKKSPQIYNEPKAVHSYQSSILNAQGVIRDNIRGVISSSAQRESPSRVFGLSTPGGPIFEGGYTSQTIKQAAKTQPGDKLKQIGRTGGHTFVMDDGTMTGDDQLIRLRSSAGHQITMSDSGQTLFIIHSNGQSWIEMGREGTIDIYSTNSFNVRTQGDINFHADRDINMNAAKNLNLFGENINMESAKNFQQRTGVNFQQYTMGSYTVKVDGSMSQASTGQASYTSSAETFVNGSKVNLNSGSAGLQPSSVPPIQKTSHIDTINSPKVGWINPSPEPMVSITNRAPAHQPWVGSGTGVDIKISSTASTQPQQTPAVAAVNAAAPSAPTAPTTPAQIAAVPSTAAAGTQGNQSLPPTAVTAITAQVAQSTQNSVAQGQTNPATIINAASGVTPQIMETAGGLKPGSAQQLTQLASMGQGLKLSASSSLTGAGGITNVTTLFTNVGTAAAAVGAAADQAMARLTSNGTLTGNESPAQAGGIVMAALTNGVAAVTNFVNSGVSSAGNMMNSISGGQFAAGLSDSLSFSGLSASLSGLADGALNKLSGLGDSINNINNALKSTLQKAFDATEKSFGELKSGVANVLGPKSSGTEPTKQPSDIAKANNQYASAEADVTAAQDALYEAQRNYRNEQTAETTTDLAQAEAALSAAKQKQAQASQAFLKAAGGGIVAGATSITGGLSSGLNSIKTTLNSGVNALPGGSGALQSLVNNSGILPAAAKASAALNMASNALTTANSVAAKLPSAAGVLDKVTSTISGTMGQIQAGASGVMAQLSTMMSAISAGGESIKSAAAAVGTFDKSALVAKTGQLLGNPKIPSPESVAIPSPEESPEDPNAQSAEVTVAIGAVNDATASVNAAKLKLDVAIEGINEPGGLDRVKTATAALEREEAALKTAQDSYSAIITSA